LAICAPQWRNARVHQLKLRRIERVLHRNNWGEYRHQKKQRRHRGGNHGNSGAAERIEQVTLDGAPKPSSGPKAHLLSAGIGLMRCVGFVRYNSV
jgi:hypothetical protein